MFKKGFFLELFSVISNYVSSELFDLSKGKASNYNDSIGDVFFFTKGLD